MPDEIRRRIVVDASGAVAEINKVADAYDRLRRAATGAQNAAGADGGGGSSSGGGNSSNGGPNDGRRPPPQQPHPPPNPHGFMGQMREAGDAAYHFGMGAQWSGVPGTGFLFKAGNLVQGADWMIQGFTKVTTGMSRFGAGLLGATVGVTAFAAAVVETSHVFARVVDKLTSVDELTGGRNASGLVGVAGVSAAAAMAERLSVRAGAMSPAEAMRQMTVARGVRPGEVMPYGYGAGDPLAAMGVSRFNGIGPGNIPIQASPADVAFGAAGRLNALSPDARGMMLGRFQGEDREVIALLARLLQRGETRESIEGRGKGLFKFSEEDIRKADDYRLAQMRLGNELEQLGFKLGRYAIPVLTEVVHLVSGVVAGFNAIVDALRGMAPFFKLLPGGAVLNGTGGTDDDRHRGGPGGGAPGAAGSVVGGAGGGAAAASAAASRYGVLGAVLGDRAGGVIGSVVAQASAGGALGAMVGTAGARSIAAAAARQGNAVSSDTAGASGVAGLGGYGAPGGRFVKSELGSFYVPGVGGPPAGGSAPGTSAVHAAASGATASTGPIGLQGNADRLFVTMARFNPQLALLGAVAKSVDLDMRLVNPVTKTFSDVLAWLWAKMKAVDVTAWMRKGKKGWDDFGGALANLVQPMRDVATAWDNLITKASVITWSILFKIGTIPTAPDLPEKDWMIKFKLGPIPQPDLPLIEWMIKAKLGPIPQPDLPEKDWVIKPKLGLVPHDLLVLADPSLKEIIPWVNIAAIVEGKTPYKSLADTWYKKIIPYAGLDEERAATYKALSDTWYKKIIPYAGLDDDRSATYKSLSVDWYKKIIPYAGLDDDRSATYKSLSVDWYKKIIPYAGLDDDRSATYKSLSVDWYKKVIPYAGLDDDRSATYKSLSVDWYKKIIPYAGLDDDRSATYKSLSVDWYKKIIPYAGLDDDRSATYKSLSVDWYKKVIPYADTTTTIPGKTFYGELEQAMIKKINPYIDVAATPPEGYSGYNTLSSAISKTINPILSSTAAADLQTAVAGLGKPAVHVNLSLPSKASIYNAYPDWSKPNIGGDSLTWDPIVVYGAAGGIVTRPTRAIIGEAGPEMVVPLNRTPGSSPLPSGFGGGITINVHVAAGDFSDPNHVAKMAQVVGQEIAKNLRLTGLGGRIA